MQRDEWSIGMPFINIYEDAQDENGNKHYSRLYFDECTNIDVDIIDGILNKRKIKNYIDFNNMNFYKSFLIGLIGKEKYNTIKLNYPSRIVWTIDGPIIMNSDVWETISNDAEYEIL